MVRVLIKLILVSTARGKGRKLGTNDQENNFCHFSEDIFLREMGGIHPLTC